MKSTPFRIYLARSTPPTIRTSPMTTGRRYFKIRKSKPRVVRFEPISNVIYYREGKYEVFVETKKPIDNYSVEQFLQEWGTKPKANNTLF